MPGPTRFRGASLLHAVTANKVSTKTLNDRVRAVLRLIKTASRSGIAEKAPELQLNRPEDRQLLRKVAAESVVLLKNEGDVLPFRADEEIAVIGPNAQIATYCGGGSAGLNAYAPVTPYEGIRRQATGGVVVSQGIYGHQMLPLLGKSLRTADGAEGFSLRVYNEPPTAPARRLLEERRETDSMVFFLDYSHPELRDVWYADAQGTFTPAESGVYDFGLCLQGTGRLYLDGKLLVRNDEDQRLGPSFLGGGTLEETASAELRAGQAYDVLVQWGCARTSRLKKAGTVEFGHGGFRIGGCRRLDPEEGIRAAAAVAARVRQVVVFAGLSGEWESEGEDRTTMDLPPHTDALIARVLDANPRAVVVLQSGTPVALAPSWAGRAPALLHAWYGGEEAGDALADVLLGAVNPSGRLPLTFPRRLRDNPAYLNYRSEAGRVLYGEDVYVGYRYYDAADVAPLFPFGHGLSYTTFALSRPRLSLAAGGREASATVTVRNTGKVPGTTVLQLYVLPPAEPAPGTPRRAPQELKAFAKVRDLEVGGTRDVTLRFDVVRDTSFWDETTSMWCSPVGEYQVRVGLSSRDEQAVCSQFEVKETKWWSGLAP